MGSIMNIRHRVSQAVRIMKIIMKAHRVRMRQRVVEDMMMSIMKVQNVGKSHTHARPIGRLRPGHGSGGCFRIYYGRDDAIINLCPEDEESTAATRKCMRIHMTNKLRLSRSQSSAFVCVCWHLGTNKGREIPMQCEGWRGREEKGAGQQMMVWECATCEDTLKHEAGCGKFEPRLTAC